MTPRDWMALALRVLGVWFATQAVLAVARLMGVFVQFASMLIGSDGPGLTVFVGAMLQFLAYSAIAAVLLVFTDAIVARLYPEETPPPPLR
jgi:Na+/phosphate symporter